MAHAATLGALTDELVTLLTSITAKSSPAKYNACSETALRNLRTLHLRTNQFEIAGQLDGLDEKLRVYLQDPLADALKERLDVVGQADVKWAPEILHFLLELSDQPVSKSKVENLDFIKQPKPDISPPLQWKDLVAEDPLLRDKKVWGNVDFAAESSDEDSQSEASVGSETTVLSSIDDGYIRRPEQYAVDTLDEESLQKLRAAQFWKESPHVNGVRLETVEKSITELHAIREVLFMLSGFPSSLFEINSKKPGIIMPSKSYAWRHASNEGFLKLLQDFADQGYAISVLRLWAARKQSIPLIQILQHCITERMRGFDSHVSTIEERFIAPPGDVLVSLLGVQLEINPILRLLTRLSEIVKRLDAEPYAHAFRYLEMLYDQTSMSQMAGDDEMYVFMGTIFFECFQIYLRPMRTWMEDGELQKDDNVSFVSEAAGEIDLASLWTSRFKLRRTKSGTLHAPKFLQPSAGKIFTTGKSVVVLKHLNRFASLQASRHSLEPSLDFETVCNPSHLQLAPFPDLFDAAFSAWVRSKHHHTSFTLRKTLFDSCGLHTSLDAISHLYFLADGIVGANFANFIFDKLDTLDASWNDRFTLTELAQSTLGTLPSISSERLRTSILSLPRKFEHVATCRRSVRTLAIIQLKYRLSWPIQTILTPTATPLYQQIFTFLLQIRRSSHILSRQRLVKDMLIDLLSTDERVLYYSLRTRLLWFTQTLYYYLTALVFEPNSQTMLANLRDAEDVDSMIQVHESYIKVTFNQALLGSKLELIHKTILKILDQAIQLEDMQAANSAARKEADDQQREMMDMSMASLGLHTPRKSSMPLKFSQSTRRMDEDDEDYEADVDLSILSSTYDDGDELYVDELRKKKAEFDRQVRFVASGLRGVARAGVGRESRSWDLLGEMLDGGLVRGLSWR